jgi:TM2 domain-containing membrane protein YozV
MDPHEEKMKKMAVNQGDTGIDISQPTTNPHITIVNQQSSPPRGMNPALLVDAADKSPGLAAFLSFLFVGLGQLYNGQIGKGLLVMFVNFVFWGVAAGGESVGFILLFILWIWVIFDAHSVAKRKRLNWLMVLHGR